MFRNLSFVIFILWLTTGYSQPCPPWIPKEKCKDFQKMIELAKEYQDTLFSDIEIVDIRKDGDSVILKFKRYNQDFEIVINNLKIVKLAYMKEGKAVIEVEEVTIYSKIKYYLGGFCSGILAVLLFVLIL